MLATTAASGVLEHAARKERILVWGCAKVLNCMHFRKKILLFSRSAKCCKIRERRNHRPCRPLMVLGSVLRFEAHAREHRWQRCSGACAVGAVGGVLRYGSGARGAAY